VKDGQEDDNDVRIGENEGCRGADAKAEEEEVQRALNPLKVASQAFIGCLYE
jgi:hypothetical protein